MEKEGRGRKRKRDLGHQQSKGEVTTSHFHGDDTVRANSGVSQGTSEHEARSLNGRRKKTYI